MEVRIYRNILFNYLMLVPVLFFIIAPIFAEPGQENENNDPIILERCDHMEIFLKQNYAILTGNVIIRNGESKISSDKLTIYYKKTKKDSADNKKTPGENSIDKILAEGNVKIHSPEMDIFTNKAVYTAKDQMLICTGPDSKVVSDTGTINCCKITYNKKDGHIKFEPCPGESLDNNPITGTFSSDGADFPID